MPPSCAAWCTHSTPTWPVRPYAKLPQASTTPFGASERVSSSDCPAEPWPLSCSPTKSGGCPNFRLDFRYQHRRPFESATPTRTIRGLGRLRVGLTGPRATSSPLTRTAHAPSRSASSCGCSIRPLPRRRLSTTSEAGRSLVTHLRIRNASSGRGLGVQRRANEPAHVRPDTPVPTSSTRSAARTDQPRPTRRPRRQVVGCGSPPTSTRATLRGFDLVVQQVESSHHSTVARRRRHHKLSQSVF